jgi:hypothetical protein
VPPGTAVRLLCGLDGTSNCTDLIPDAIHDHLTPSPHSFSSFVVPDTDMGDSFRKALQASRTFVGIRLGGTESGPKGTLLYAIYFAEAKLQDEKF